MGGSWGGTRLVTALLLALLVATGLAADDGLTQKHEKGRCAIRGHCGSDSFFGPQLPCPDNGLAKTPEADVREKLVNICGDKWVDTDVCCEEEQIDALQSNLKRAESLIASCPACKENFFNMFCTFTCSPDQSLFVNVTKTKPKSDKLMVQELTHVVSNDYASLFYDSCKDVKVGATNGNAMDLIGGGAKNYTRFLKFLGDKKFLGSPFQMNFPDPSLYPGLKPQTKGAKACSDPDERYRCACVDCPSVCPELPEVQENKQCHVGVLPCLSFAVIIIYSVFILLLIVAVSGHVAYEKHHQHKQERLRLLQDLEPSDDEDEGDIVAAAGMLETPTRKYKLNDWCDKVFSRLGYACAEFPAITILSSVVVVVLLSLGWLRFTVETDPVRLWVAPDSAAAQEKVFFDENFGPFYRTEQAFLVNDTNPSGPGPVLSYETLRWWFDVEHRVNRLMAEGITFDDVCFKPTGDACVVESITGYFGGDFSNIDPKTWEEDLRACANSPVDCLPAFQQPLNPSMLLGGGSKNDILDSQALIVSWVVNNHQEGTEELETAMIWENSLRSLLRAVQDEAAERGLRVSFNTEISLEQELNKSTNTDAKIVVVSYIIMFLYASLALGSTTLSVRTILQNPANALVQSKFMLGVVGIIIVLMSVSASVGLFSAVGIKVTLIIAEVIPFLVLAVGVDNIFLIVHEFERVNLSHAEGSVSERVAKALGRMGPSILLSATTETATFALGAAVGMPAVRNFAAYAAGAVFVNALLQVTMFISVLALNQRRVEASRADCFPCLRVTRADPGGISTGVVYGGEEEGTLQRFIRKTYAPTLLGKKTKTIVITVFLGLFTAGLALLPNIELGLDQRIAIPSDSYLINYFNDLYDYFGVGPPVYFVAQDLNATQRKHQQELCGRFSTCEELSLANTLEQERKRPDTSYIADAAASWIDDYFLWLNPSLDSCCYDEGSNPFDDKKACFADRNPPWNPTLKGMPEGQEFIEYLERWMEAPTTGECPLAGKAAYGNALVVDSEALTIPASHFRTSHTPLRSQKDFIDAYASARRIASDISDRTGISVFPYSKFYIFFDQYASIVSVTCALVGSALALILVVTSTLLGSLRTGVVVTVTVAMTVVDIAGTMAVAGVSLNAVSLVNLIICVGIAVEFCAHIARAFTYPSQALLERAAAPKARFRGKDARAWVALTNVGGSVFSGITVTKFLGVAVLAFTRSKIFEIYYFRVWLALVVWAAAHALIFLPAALSLFGGRGYLDAESEGGLEQDLRGRRGYHPALYADEDYDSDDM